MATNRFSKIYNIYWYLNLFILLIFSETASLMVSQNASMTQEESLNSTVHSTFHEQASNQSLNKSKINRRQLPFNESNNEQASDNLDYSLHSDLLLLNLLKSRIDEVDGQPPLGVEGKLETGEELAEIYENSYQKDPQVDLSEFAGNNSSPENKIDEDVERLVRSQLDLAASDWAKAESTISPTLQLNFNLAEFLTEGQNLSSLLDENGSWLSRDLTHDSKGEENRVQSSPSGPRSGGLGVDDKLHANHNYNRSYGDEQDPGKAASQDPLSTSSDGSMRYSSTELFSRATTPIPNLSNKNHHLANQLISRYMYRLRGPITNSALHLANLNERKASEKLISQVHTTTLAPNIRRAFERLDRLRLSMAAGLDKVDANQLKPVYESAMPGKISPKGFIDVVVAPAHSNAQQVAADYSSAQNSIPWTASSILAAENNSTGSSTIVANSNQADKIVKLSQTGRRLPPPVQQKDHDNSAERQRGSLERNKSVSSKNKLLAKQLSLSRMVQAEQKAQQLEPLTLNLENLLKHREKHNLLAADSTSPSVQYYTTQGVSYSPSTTAKPSTTSGKLNRPMQNLAPALYAAALNSLAGSRIQSSTMSPTSTTKTPAPQQASASNVQLKLPSAQHHHLHSHIHSIKPAVISIPLPIQSKLLAPYANMLAAMGSKSTQTSTNTIRPISNVQLRKVQPPQRKHHLISSQKSIPIGGKLASANLVHQKNSEKGERNLAQIRSSLLSNLIVSANKAIKQVVSRGAGGGEGRLPANKVKKKWNQQEMDEAEWLQQQQLPLLHQAEGVHLGFGQSEPDGTPLDTIRLYQPTGANESPPFEAYLSELVGAEKQAPSALTNFQELASNNDHLLALNDARPLLLPLLHTQLTGSTPFKASASSHAPQVNRPVDWDGNGTSAPDIQQSLEEPIIFASLGDNSNLLYPILAANNGALGPEAVLATVGGQQDQANLFGAFNSLDWQTLASFPDEHKLPLLLNNFTHPKQTTPSLSVENLQRIPKNVSFEQSADRFPAPVSKDNYYQTSSDSLPFALAHYAHEQEPQQTKFEVSKQPSLHYDMFDDKANKYPANSHRQTQRPASSSGLNRPASELDNLLPVQETHNSQSAGTSAVAGDVYQPPTHFIQFHYPRHLVLQPSEQQQLFASPPTRSPQTALANSLESHLLAARKLVNYHKQQLIDNHFLAHHYNPSVMQKARQHSLAHTRDMATSESSHFPVGPLARASMLASFWPLAVAMLPIMIVVAIVAQLIMAAPLIMFAVTTLTVSRFAASLMGSPFNSRASSDFLATAANNSSDIIDKIQNFNNSRLSNHSIISHWPPENWTQ